MGSPRLPGKVLMALPKVHTYGAKSRVALDWTIEACSKTGFQVYVATSTNPEDDLIENHVCARYPAFSGDAAVGLFRGSPDDVLDRLYQCAKLHQLDEIIRVTADC